MKFYYDLSNDNKTGRVKFPSWTCSYKKAIQNNQTTCQISLLGTKNKALNAAEPPKDRNFYLIMQDMKMSYYSGIWFEVPYLIYT